MTEEIEVGDMVKFKPDFYRRKNKEIARVTALRKSRAMRSGIGVQVEGSKTFYDSGWFTILEKFMPIKFDL